MNLKRLARDERADFAAFLATLSPQQWDAPTLCEGWRVRDVVAHVVSYDELDMRSLVGRLAKGRFHPDNANAVGLAEYGTRTPEELLALLKEHVDPHGLPAAFGGMIALVDALIHQQDIRRPLGLPRGIPAERLLPALRCALFAPVIRGFWRVRGLRLVATDLDWSTGRGPEVHGTAEALLMVIAGRRGVVDELSGPGQPKLAERLGG
ncbi:TIGR03083 family protein [Amycolatopsis marina]|uniref:TIGR03083 family protein n=1 Tax=Amycolatopsis marina TaxID=490629 RepID=A0A1I0W1K0_9PSEU|nr:maleylpyruvate isomerase family mycothiol-dependent enzyme [Amycolatopsis marina]SFA82481.1 TIGR03083 family protein [Amycolatopsis marina]